MDHKKIWELEHAIHCMKNNYKIIWNTSLGIAEFNSLKYLPSQPLDPIFSEELSYFGIHKNTGTVGQNIFNKSIDELKKLNIDCMKNEPDLLLKTILDTINGIKDDDLKYPKYNCLFNFKSIDKHFELPFVLNGLDLVNEPIALVLEN